MSTLTCGFVGLGLIGGSIAKAIRQALPETVIYAYDINPSSLLLALEEGIADYILSSVSEDFSACDFIFLCAPVSHNDENLKLLKPFLKETCILTDVGSVKTSIHKHIAAAGLSSFFIGGHPMAGSERFGYQNAKASLLENAYYILTPSPGCSNEKLKQYEELVTKMSAIPLILPFHEHDYITAGISHLPHVIASSLVNLVKHSDNTDNMMKTIAAGGFKDITRIASSSPDMWQQICLTNTENITRLLSDYIASLTVVKNNLETQNAKALYSFFEEARAYRDSFIEAGSGPIKKVYSIAINIPDEPGALAAIATVLALNQISIKNIGIVHNREYEEGVLRIEFWEETAIHSAVALLKTKGYSLHERN